MKTVNELSRRTAELENTSQAGGQEVTIEKAGDLEIMRWGKTIVKCIRGVSFSDL